MKLSIVIPVFNEERTVGKILERVIKAELPKGWKREIIVVDDGSGDNSVGVIGKFKALAPKFEIRLLKQKHRGKGAAVRAGIGEAKGDVVLIQDADLEYDPKDYGKLLEPIELGTSNVVYGSRLLELPFRLFGREKTVFPSHYLGNRFLTGIANWLFGISLTDIETGYKVFKKEEMEEVRLVSDGFEIEPELTAKLAKRGCRIMEVPISIEPRGYDQGKKIHWWHGARAAATLFYYRFFDG